jgi:hypothetical protein
MGHLYLKRPVRAFLYAFGFFGPMFIIAAKVARRSYFPGDMLVIFLFIAFVVWLINMIDMIVTLLRGKPSAKVGESGQSSDERIQLQYQSHDNERFQTILLSFIPGLGHFQLGLMQRGLVFLTGFFGTLVMVFFVCFLLKKGEFLVFLGAMPIIWLYSMFDALQQVNRKQRGEDLVDRSILEDFQDSRQDGRKNKMIATILSVFPGAGHMYLGLQRRGLQLMATFLFSIYILDVLHLSLFLFFIPIIWFYSFFDALQSISKEGREELQDVPFVDWLINHQKWIGIILLALGAYYLLDEMVLGILEKLFPKQNISYWFHRYFQTFVVSVLLIGGGIRLMIGSKKK